MSTFRKSIATSCCAIAAGALWVSTSFAQQATPVPPPAPGAAAADSTTTQPKTVQSQPAQQSTTQTTTTQQPVPAAAAPAAPVATQQSTTTTTAAPYAYNTPSSDRYTEREIAHRPNRVLLSTGTGLFVLSYGGSVIAGAVSDREEDKRLFIPVVGPWLNLGQRDCGAATPCGGNEDLAKAMIVTSGVVQGAGILMALGSFFIPETTTVTERTQTAKTKPTVKVLPVSFAAGAGVGAVGRF
jgi:hypothetical protein